MNKSNFGTIIAVLVIAALLAGTWFIAISPRLAEISTANDDRERAEALNVGHEATLRRLQALAEGIEDLERDLAVLSVAIPDDLAYSSYLRELQAIGDATGTAIAVMGEPSLERYVAPVESDALHPEVAAAVGSVSTDNFVVVDLNINISGETARVFDAITRIQETQRFGLVHNFTFPANPADPAAAVDATLQLQLFTLLSQPVAAGAGTADAAVEGEQPVDESGAFAQ
ncbi:MAG: hypothetical protein IR160_08710 [Salinibacterium sp.]|nr:hypothetical protein [Salinibacterium sp.]MBF0672652.1 hypothetical protein [Salinibacterium sp.]